MLGDRRFAVLDCASDHPGVITGEVRSSGFDLDVSATEVIRPPTVAGLRLIRELIDPRDARNRGVWAPSAPESTGPPHPLASAGVGASSLVSRR